VYETLKVFALVPDKTLANFDERRPLVTAPPALQSFTANPEPLRSLLFIKQISLHRDLLLAKKKQDRPRIAPKPTLLD
jgi:hypothetical protein